MHGAVQPSPQVPAKRCLAKSHSKSKVALNGLAEGKLSRASPAHQSSHSAINLPTKTPQRGAGTTRRVTVCNQSAFATPRLTSSLKVPPKIISDDAKNGHQTTRKTSLRNPELERRKEAALQHVIAHEVTVPTSLRMRPAPPVAPARPSSPRAAALMGSFVIPSENHVTLGRQQDLFGERSQAGSLRYPAVASNERDSKPSD